MNIPDSALHPRGAFRVRVSRHAQARYLYRVCSGVHDVRAAIKAMWFQSCPATDLDLECAGAQREEGAVYRVGRGPDGLRCVMVARENVILTILRMR